MRQPKWPWPRVKGLGVPCRSEVSWVRVQSSVSPVAWGHLAELGPRQATCSGAQLVSDPSALAAGSPLWRGQQLVALRAGA